MIYGALITNDSGFVQIDSSYRNIFYDRTIPIDLTTYFTFQPFETVLYIVPDNWEYSTSAVVTKPRPVTVDTNDYGFMVYSESGSIVYDTRARPLELKATFILPAAYLGYVNISLPPPKTGKVRCYIMTIGFGGSIGYEQYVFDFTDYYRIYVMVNTTINPSTGYWDMQWVFDTIDYEGVRILVMDI